MRALLVAIAIAVVALGASGCAGSHHRAATQRESLAQQANSICKADDRRIRKAGLWQSAAWFNAEKIKIRDLGRIGLFGRMPAIARDIGFNRPVPDGLTYRQFDQRLLKAQGDASRRGASQVLVVEEGRIVESGTHSELVSHDGLYRWLYELRSGEREPDREPMAPA
jgi:hypothetical protein